MPGTIGGSTNPTTSTRTPSTDSGVCAMSPSDLVGYVGNLISRMEAAEQEIAELKAANVTANQLSDLSQQVGWVGGITYAGTSGWTQTAYGTLIPPAGFYIGNVIPGYHAGFYDATGTLQLGFGSDGTLTGTYPTTWNAAASPQANYAFASYLGGSWTTGNRAITINTNSVSGNDIDIQFTVSQAGLYFCDGNATDSEASAPLGSFNDSLIVTVNGTQKYNVSYQSTYEPNRLWGGAVGGLLVLSASDVVRMINNPTATIDSVLKGAFSLYRVSA